MWINLELGDLVAVRRCSKRRHAEQYALVLSAMGMGSSIVPEGKLVTVYVADGDAIRANEELMAYDKENRAKRPTRKRLRTALPRFELALAYWAILLFFFAAARNNALSLDWLGVGAAQSGLMLNGEWWRAITALCLHVDTAHLLANLVFGAVFLVLLAQITGAGIAWLSMVVVGAVGNALNAILHSATHTSIGASTAIFSALGLLVALGQTSRLDRPSLSTRYWAPMVGGLTLLVLLGFSGEKTDISAHVLGFVSGIAAGWLLARWNRDWPADRDLQWKCGGIAGAIVVTAWVAATLS